MTYQKMIQSDPHFNVMRITPDFIEFRSVNTGHYWTIKKRYFQNGCIYRLYHKHSCETEYYHLHKDNCYNVKSVINLIKNHDTWVLKNT
mgnify:CR=1 FL=1